MRLSFITPAALWLLVSIFPLWALALIVPRRLPPVRFWASLLLRTALLTALVLALAGAQVVRNTDALTTIFLLDRSDSIAAAARARGDAFVRDALRAARPSDRSAVIAFGEQAIVAHPPADDRAFDPIAVKPIASRTNIQDALALGLALLPSETNKRLVLLSDGGENAGDAQVAARLAAERGVPISYVDIGTPATKEALVSSVDAPANIRAGQMFDLTATVQSTVAQKAHLRILRGNQVLSDKDVSLQPGQNRFSVNVNGTGAGFQRYRAEITPQQDGRAENNRAEALVRVGGPARVLLVAGAPGEAQNFKDALAAAHVGADIVAPQALPANLAQLQSYDAVVLIDVAASALPAAAMAALPSYVRDLGRGLVMIGGEQSFGIGGYGHTPVEQALPVYMDVREQRERPSMALVFVLDKSASMGRCHCDGPDRNKDGYYDRNGPYKINISKEAVVQSVAVLDKRDTVGVVAFDGEAHWAFPPQRGPTPTVVQSAIASIGPTGTTNVFAGLAAAEEALKQTNAASKHIILMTDGWAHGDDPLAVARRMHAEGITLSVVADGRGSAPYLQDLAQAGGGRYWPVEQIEDVPQIFVRETITASANYLVEQRFTPKYGVDSPILAGLKNGLPALYGYNATSAKKTATTVLLGVDDAPVLAQWQYGLGRAVVWTSDLKGKWAKDWVRWPQFSRFAAQLVGWVLPSGPTNGLSAELRTEGAQTLIRVAAQDPRGQPLAGLALRAAIVGPAGGSPQNIALSQVAPGTYTAEIPTPPAGTYMVQLNGAQNGRITAQETVGLVVPYSPEYRLGAANPSLLDTLATLSGGARLAQPADAFAHNLQGASSAQEIGLPLILLALMLLPLDIGIRRLLFNGRQTTNDERRTTTVRATGRSPQQGDRETRRE